MTVACQTLYFFSFKLLKQNNIKTFNRITDKNRRLLKIVFFLLVFSVSDWEFGGSGVSRLGPIHLHVPAQMNHLQRSRYRPLCGDGEYTLFWACLRTDLVPSSLLKTPKWARSIMLWHMAGGLPRDKRGRCVWRWEWDYGLGERPPDSSGLREKKGAKKLPK